jgi:hypothetical protein
MLAAALAVMAATSAAATEPTTEQENAIRHIVEAAMLVKMCPGAEMNGGEMRAIMAYYDLPTNAFADGGPFHDAATRIADKAKADAGGFSTYQACTAATAMYGPAGGNVPDLIRQSN